MFDEENQTICWFDTEVQADALGVPEGELNEFMLNVGCPVAITERAYTSPGRVKAVIIKHFGPDAPLDALEGLQGFIGSFGLTFICRPKSGMNLDFNGGRYYSTGHTPYTN